MTTYQRTSLTYTSRICKYFGLETLSIQLTVLLSGGHAPSYLYRIVADHYRAEDINL